MHNRSKRFCLPINLLSFFKLGKFYLRKAYFVTLDGSINTMMKRTRQKSLKLIPYNRVKDSVS